jgi:hypothetical protein
VSAKDRRLYGRFTLDFADSPKIAPLSDAAFRTLVEMTLHSRRMLDDGFVDARIAARKWKRKAIDELLTNDAVNPSLSVVDGGYQIHDFAEHQQTRADIEEKRTAGSKGGRASAQARAQAGASADGEAHPKLITETETETTPKGVSRATRIPEPFIVKTEMRAWAAKEVPSVDVDRATRMFVDYWRAKSGRDATKADWEATWRNWLRRDFDSKPGAKAAPTRKVPANDEWMYR